VTEARSWPRRRVRRTCTEPSRIVGRGSSIAHTSSSGPRTVTPDRTKNSSLGIRRLPAGPTATTSAPWMRSAGTVSAAGEALQTLPARVARFRIWVEPTTAAASARAWKSRPMRGSAPIAVITVRAPMDNRPPSSRIDPSSSAILFRSTTTSARIDPSRRRMIRSVPPASTRARGPCSASRATASSRSVGRS
jgi:hypothetical protein